MYERQMYRAVDRILTVAGTRSESNNISTHRENRDAERQYVLLGSRSASWRKVAISKRYDFYLETCVAFSRV